MKLIATILISAFLISSLIAKPNPKRNMQNHQNTISSLMIGLDSDNLGLKSSSAYMLGELKVSESIIPLMKMLRENENEELRIAAALALYKIGTPMAIHAVKQSIRFDESKRVSTLCANFYNEHLRDNFDDEEKNETLVETARK